MRIPDEMTLDAPIGGGRAASSPYPGAGLEVTGDGGDDDDDDAVLATVLEVSRLEALAAAGSGGAPRISRPPMPRIGPLASGSGAAAEAEAATGAASPHASGGGSATRDSAIFDVDAIAASVSSRTSAADSGWGPEAAAAAATRAAALAAGAPLWAGGGGDDEDEEAMLQRAIAASLAEAGGAAVGDSAAVETRAPQRPA